MYNNCNDSHKISPVSHSYFSSQHNAEVAVRQMLREIAMTTQQKTGEAVLRATDRMDDGSTIQLCVDINEQEVP